MRTKKGLFLFIGVGAAVAAVVVMHRASERRIRALEQRLQAVAEEQSEGAEASRRPVVVLAAPPPATPAPAPAAPVAASAAPKSSPAEADVPTVADQAAYVGVAFAQERPDTAWAADTERAIGASLRGLAQTSTVESVECKQSLCKASLKHPSQDQFSEFIDRVIAHSAEVWPGEVMSYRDAVGGDGVVRNSIYFARNGHAVPSLQ